MLKAAICVYVFNFARQRTTRQKAYKFSDLFSSFETRILVQPSLTAVIASTYTEATVSETDGSDDGGPRISSVS
jgi:hypothetical protein